MTDTIKIKMRLSIGLIGTREEIIRFDASDIPNDPAEREAWLHQQWQWWAVNYVDGGATVEETTCE